MKLGVNSVLFRSHDMATAWAYTARCGYDGIEISAITDMNPHLALDRWRELVPQIKALVKSHDLPILAMEQNKLDPELMTAAFQAAGEIGCPIVNCGPGGKTGDQESLTAALDSLGALAEEAGSYGVTLCVKAHVGACIHDTPTSLIALEAIDLPSFGLDMDPSHIHRAGENPVDAVAAVANRIRHVHIRDCKGGQGPGTPEMQANGRGDIDLLGYIRVLHESGYTGPVDLEVIGAKDYGISECVAIAAEARGHMQACLQACGAR